MAPTLRISVGRCRVARRKAGAATIDGGANPLPVDAVSDGARNAAETGKRLLARVPRVAAALAVPASYPNG